MRRIVIFTCDDHYRPKNATWVRDLCTFCGILMEKSNKVRHTCACNVTQIITDVLAVATVFIGL